MATRDFSKVQEDRVAKHLRGRRQANSGATPFAKGDVITDNWLLDCKTKTSVSKNVTVTKEMLVKLRGEAMTMRRAYHALAFDFGDGEDYYIITAEDMQRLVSIDDEWV